MTERPWLLGAWYPIALASDLQRRRPVGFELMGESLVVFRDARGAPQCLADRCPHRSTPLSRATISVSVCSSG